LLSQHHPQSAAAPIELQNRLSPVARRGRRQDAEGIVFAAVLTMLFWVIGLD
jgi:hypothetical protein